MYSLFQPCGSHAPLYNYKFLGFMPQSFGVLRYHRVEKAAATTKTKLSICSFALRFLYDLIKTQDGCKAAARQTISLYH